MRKKKKRKTGERDKLLMEKRLRQIEDDSLLKWLKSMLDLEDEKDPNSYMKYLAQVTQKGDVAFKLLEFIGTPAADALIQVMKSSHPILRQRAIFLLGKIGDKRVIEALKKASNISLDDFMAMKHSPIFIPDGTVLMGPKSEKDWREYWEEYRRLAKDALQSALKLMEEGKKE